MSSNEKTVDLGEALVIEKRHANGEAKLHGSSRFVVISAAEEMFRRLF
ncbi:hypothetical protein [Arthrobacter flavus]|uniref:Uncharacterized protein n=1 Tax=Arthrobacter flavus TaxID=95172 RepID=A0ABW4Q8J8_9MICC